MRFSLPTYPLFSNLVQKSTAIVPFPQKYSFTFPVSYYILIRIDIFPDGIPFLSEHNFTSFRKAASWTVFSKALWLALVVLRRD